MLIEIKTGKRERPCNSDVHTVEIWINGIRFTTDAASAEAARALAERVAYVLGIGVLL